MGIRNILRRLKRSTTAKNPAQWFIDWAGGGETGSGITVNAETALRHTPVWAAVTLIAETVATLPLHVYRRIDGGRERVANPIATLLGTLPNSHMSAGPFWEAMLGNVLLRGNAYAEIERDNAGRPIGLWPLNPTKMQIKLEPTGDLLYIYDVLHGIPAKNILHLRGFSSDGIVGYSPIMQNREQLGLGMGATRYAAAFFANGSAPDGTLQHPETLTEDAAKRLKASWEQAHSRDNAHRVAVLEEGMTWQQVALSPKDSQLVEIQRLSVEDAARIWHIPPHKLQDLTHATFSNIEHQGIEFLTQTLAPWLRRVREEVTIKLLSGELYAEHVVESLLRGDIKTRYDAYRIGIAGTFLQPNEVRAWENLPRIEGGDVLLAPLNMTTIDKLGDEPEPPPEPVVEPLVEPDDEPDDVGDEAVRAFRPILLDVIQARIITKECKALRKADPAEFYATHAKHVREVLTPTVQALAASVKSPVDPDGYLVRLADELCREAQVGLSEHEGERAELLDLWQSTRAAVLADRILHDVGGIPCSN